MIVGWYFRKGNREAHLYQGVNGGEFECWTNDPDLNPGFLDDVWEKTHDIYEVVEFLERQGYILY